MRLGDKPRPERCGRSISTLFPGTRQRPRWLRCRLGCAAAPRCAFPVEAALANQGINLSNQGHASYALTEAEAEGGPRFARCAYTVRHAQAEADDAVTARPWRRAPSVEQALKATEDQIEAELEGCGFIVGLRGVFRRDAGQGRIRALRDRRKNLLGHLGGVLVIA